MNIKGKEQILMVNPWYLFSSLEFFIWPWYFCLAYEIFSCLRDFFGFEIFLRSKYFVCALENFSTGIHEYRKKSSYFFPVKSILFFCTPCQKLVGSSRYIIYYIGLLKPQLAMQVFAQLFAQPFSRTNHKCPPTKNCI